MYEWQHYLPEWAGIVTGLVLVVYSVALLFIPIFIWAISKRVGEIRDIQKKMLSMMEAGTTKA